MKIEINGLMHKTYLNCEYPYPLALASVNPCHWMRFGDGLNCMQSTWTTYAATIIVIGYNLKHFHLFKLFKFKMLNLNS